MTDELVAIGLVVFMVFCLFIPEIVALIRHEKRDDKEPEIKSVQMILVWTRAYRPFVMGGDVNYFIGTWLVVEDLDEILTGHELVPKVYQVTNPRNGTTHIIEPSSGAFVGNDIEEVLKDLEDADNEKIREQIRWAFQMSQEAEVLEPAAFWSKFRTKG